MDDAGNLYYFNEPTNLRKKIDHIVRVKEDPDNSSFDIQPIEGTEQFFYDIYSLIQENNVLKISLKNLWKVHSYNQEYISYLLGSYSKDEFKEIAETYAEPILEDVPNNQLFTALKIICSTLNQHLNATDLSLFLNVTPSYISEEIKLLDYSPEECGIE